MSYPESVDVFSNKLNKRTDPLYVIEEILPVPGASSEKILDHDDIKPLSVEVWSGPGKTGDKITTWVLNNPVSTPWKTIISVSTSLPEIYVTYETPGDRVEAQDMNQVQTSIVSTQNEINRHKNDLNCHIDNGIIDGGSFT